MIFNERFEDLIQDVTNTIKNSYALAIFDALPNDAGKALVMKLIEKGCPANAVLEALLDVQQKTEEGESNEQ